MKTVWEYSLGTEAQRLLQCAHQMAVGFYRLNNFIVLPYNPKVKSANLVTFPDIPYIHIPRFWETAKKVDVEDIPAKVEPKVLDNLTNLLKTANLSKPDYTSIKKLWSKAEKEVLNEIYRVLPSKKRKIKKIVIYPTCFGTSCTFNWIKSDGVVYMYLRQDQGIHAICEAIITSLTRKDVYSKLEGLWQESEIITDFLVTETSIGKVLQKYESEKTYLATMKGVRIKQQAKLLEESDKFYKKLGLPTSQKVFGLNGLTPEINKKPIDKLNHQEKVLVTLLIQNNNNLVTIDQIAESIYPNDNNFSLYAISKTVERLRTKLEANGISGSYLQTLRGKGYLLKN